MTTPIKHSEIAFHGRAPAPYGYAVFTCYSRGLGSFRSDEPNTCKARQLARAYFTRQLAAIR